MAKSIKFFQRKQMLCKFDKGFAQCKRTAKKFSYFFIKACWFVVSGLWFLVVFFNLTPFRVAASFKKRLR